MPHLVICAATAALLPASDGRPNRQSPSKRKSSGLSNPAKTNPLLERFLSEQMPAQILRCDLELLPRVGRPSDGSSMSSDSANPNVTSFDPSATDGTHFLSLAQVPGMSFANYIWATSATRKMKIEAIYIEIFL